MKILKTGHEDFNRLFLNGGIDVDGDEGTSILIQGPAGSGKSTLALQLAANGIIDDELTLACLYYSFEQSSSELISMVNRFCWITNQTHKPQKCSWRDGRDFHAPHIFNIIDAQSIYMSIDDAIAAIGKHISILSESNTTGTRGKHPVIVLDSIGAIEGLIEIERKIITRLILALKQEYNAILILVRERTQDFQHAPSEYLTNVVIELNNSYQFQYGQQSNGILATTNFANNVLEIKKSRNQRSFRGPHQYDIVAKEDETPGGLLVYQNLRDIKKIKIDFSTPTESITQRALFGIKRLDDALGADGSPGIKWGQSLLVKGSPGCSKTRLGVQFLLNGVDNEGEGNLLFVSFRIDETVIENLDIYRPGELDRFKKKLKFYDATLDPHKTVEQAMADIRSLVVKNNVQQIRRAVIFGSGMLNILTGFRQHSLEFLQVLITYFRDLKISCIFIDWPPELEANPLGSDLGGPRVPIKPTDQTRDLIPGEIQIEKIEDPDALRITLVRRNHSYIDKFLGNLKPNPDTSRLEIVGVSGETGNQ